VQTKVSRTANVLSSSETGHNTAGDKRPTGGLPHGLKRVFPAFGSVSAIAGQDVSAVALTAIFRRASMRVILSFEKLPIGLITRLSLEVFAS